MKIVYVGNHSVEHTTERSYSRAFEALGHEVVPFQENDASGWPHQDGFPDLLLWTHTHGWSPGAWGLAQIAALRAEGVPTAALHLDRWWGLRRERDVATEPMFQLDHVFTADGDYTRRFIDAGVNHHWLRAGVPEDGCYIAEPDRHRWPYLVAFAGSAGNFYHQEWPHRNELVERLRGWYGAKFAHVGHGGTEPVQRRHDLNVLYASVPIVLGDSCQLHERTRYWSDRPYETWGRGGFLIFPHVRALVDEVGPYSSWPIGDWDALHATIDNALEDPAARRSERDRLHRVVRDRCTYRQRAEELLHTLGLE